MQLLTLWPILLLFSRANSFTIPTLFRKYILSARSDSSPNSIATLYPNNVTGTINGTIAVVQISYKLAWSIIPPQYGILKETYESLLTDFPCDSYPVTSLLFSSSVIKHPMLTNFAADSSSGV
jgi:hypothetical protein